MPETWTTVAKDCDYKLLGSSLESRSVYPTDDIPSNAFEICCHGCGQVVIRKKPLLECTPYVLEETITRRKDRAKVIHDLPGWLIGRSSRAVEKRSCIVETGAISP